MFDRLEQVDESVVAGYNAFCRLIHLDVKKVAYVLENGTYIKYDSETNLYCFCWWECLLKNYQRCGIRHSMFRRTRPMASPREAAEESLANIDRVLLIDVMTLSLPRRSPKASTWASSTAVMDSTVWKLWTCGARGCSASVMPVFFSYDCKADSKSARKRQYPEWSAMVREEMWRSGGGWFAVRK